MTSRFSILVLKLIAIALFALFIYQAFKINALVS